MNQFTYLRLVMKHLFMFPFEYCFEMTNQGTKYLMKDGSVRSTAPIISYSHNVSRAKMSSLSVHKMGYSFPKTGRFILGKRPRMSKYKTQSGARRDHYCHLLRKR